MIQHLRSFHNEDLPKRHFPTHLEYPKPSLATLVQSEPPAPAPQDPGDLRVGDQRGLTPGFGENYPEDDAWSPKQAVRPCSLSPGLPDARYSLQPIASSPDRFSSGSSGGSTSSATISDLGVGRGRHQTSGEHDNSYERPSLQLPRIETPISPSAQPPAMMNLSGLGLERPNLNMRQSYLGGNPNGYRRRETRSKSPSTPYKRLHECDFPGCGKSFSYESKLRYVYKRSSYQLSDYLACCLLKSLK